MIINISINTLVIPLKLSERKAIWLGLYEVKCGISLPWMFLKSKQKKIKTQTTLWCSPIWTRASTCTLGPDSCITKVQKQITKPSVHKPLWSIHWSSLIAKSKLRWLQHARASFCYSSASVHILQKGVKWGQPTSILNKYQCQWCHVV